MRSISALKLLLFIAAVCSLSSCQKELSIDVPPGNTGGNGNGNNTSNIVGEYNFVGMTAHTSSTVEVSQAGQNLKTVTVSDYNTQNNSGTVKITANQVISTDNAYSIDTIMNGKTYIDGILVDDSDFPFVVSSPPTSSTSSYVRNSTDSITITGPIGFPDPSGNISTGSVGSKLSWHGDTLYMKVATTFTQTITQGGVPATVTGTVTGISKLKKR
ncbi:MAG: hypothetical protein ACHQFX_14970 [Chitinophagales bacterium]